jgi:hypothetical protein
VYFPAAFHPPPAIVSHEKMIVIFATAKYFLSVSILVKSIKKYPYAQPNMALCAPFKIAKDDRRSFYRKNFAKIKSKLKHFSYYKFIE